MIRVLIWNENVHERTDPRINAVYPEGIHSCIGSYLSQQANITVRYATLDMPGQGLSEELLSHPVE